MCFAKEMFVLKRKCALLKEHVRFQSTTSNYVEFNRTFAKRIFMGQKRMKFAKSLIPKNMTCPVDVQEDICRLEKSVYIRHRAPEGTKWSFL